MQVTKYSFSARQKRIRLGCLTLTGKSFRYQFTKQETTRRHVESRFCVWKQMRMRMQIAHHTSSPVDRYFCRRVNFFLVRDCTCMTRPAPPLQFWPALPFRHYLWQSRSHLAIVPGRPRQMSTAKGPPSLTPSSSPLSC